MSARPSKRPRTRSVARREREEVPTLASVLLPLAQQGFLGHQELCRLSQTSRQLRTHCKEELWKTLCFYRWRNTADFTGAEIDLHGGHSGWYRHRVCPIVTEQTIEPPPLDPPSFEPGDFDILVDMTRGGESLVSATFTGTELQCMLKEGGIHVSLRKPAPLGQAACFLQGACSCDARCRFNVIEDGFDATMHLRRVDGTICRICQAMKHDPCYRLLKDGARVRFPVDGHSRWWEEPESNHIYLGPGVPNEDLGLPLCWTPLAGEIYHRLRAAISFGILFFVEIIEHQGEKLAAITGFQIDVLKASAADSHWTRFKSEEEAKKHGVTLLHILQELQGISP